MIDESSPDPEPDRDFFVHSFTDFSLLTPLAGLAGFACDLPPRGTHRIVNEYTLVFFDQYVKGDPSMPFDALRDERVETIFSNVKKD